MSNIVIKKFKEYRKGGLVGFVDIEIPRVGMEVRGISWFNKDGRQWFNMPSEKYTDDNGDTKYRPHILFPEKRIYGAFQEAMKNAMAEYMRDNQAPPMIQAINQAVEEPPQSLDVVPF